MYNTRLQSYGVSKFPNFAFLPLFSYTKVPSGDCRMDPVIPCCSGRFKIVPSGSGVFLRRVMGCCALPNLPKFWEIGSACVYTQCYTVHPILTNEGSIFRARSLNDDVTSNFGSQVPPPKKKWNFGPPIGLSGMSDKKFKIYISLGLLIIWTPLRQSWRNYYGWWLPWMGLLGGPTTSPNKSKMAVCSHIQFRKMLISPYWYLCKSW